MKMKTLLFTLIVLSSVAHAEFKPLPPMNFTPMPPMQPMEFPTMPNPNDFPEGTSFGCQESNKQFLLFRYEKKTCPNGVSFQSQSIKAFDVEQNCLDQAEVYNEAPSRAPRNTNQQQNQSC